MDWDMCTHITYVFCFEWRWLIGDNMVACFINCCGQERKSQKPFLTKLLHKRQIIVC